MTGFAILDVAIGLVLVYLVLSLIATSFGEIIARLFRWRADTQLKAVRSFMGENDAFNPMTSHLYAAPEIEALRESKPGGKQSDPSYIDPDIFTGVFLNFVIGNDWRQLGAMPDIQKRRIATFAEKVDKNDARNSRERVASILSNHVDETGGDLAKLQAAIKKWFLQVNDRATGWYKWRINKAMITIGFVLAIMTNADTIQILSNLSTDPALRETAVKIALDYAKEETPAPPDPPVDNETVGAGKTAIKEAKKQLGVIEPLIGWSCLDPVGRMFCSEEQITDLKKYSEIEDLSTLNKIKAVVAKFFGLALTALAISLGAPFWFDLLQKIIKIRSSLKPREDEKKKQDKAGDADSAAATGTGALPGTKAALTDSAAVTPGAYTAGITGFLPTTREYFAQNNLWLTRCAQLAYEDPEEIEQECKSWGLKSKFIETRQLGAGKHHGMFKSGTQAFIAWNDTMAILSFRGTETDEVHDVVTDVEFALVKPAWMSDPGDVLIHKGFRNALDDVWLNIWKEVLELGGQSIWLAGHSLGGALALLAAYRLSDRIARHNKKLRVRINEIESAEGLDEAVVKGRRQLLTEQMIGSIAGVYTAGQPRCGNDAFVREVERRVGAHVFRNINNRDIVPRIPLRSMGYRHAGSVRYIDESGKVHSDPGLWYRLLDTLVISPDDIKVAAGETIKDHSIELYVSLLERSLQTNT